MAATVLLLAACGSEDIARSQPSEDEATAEPGNGYVGAVEGTDAFVAIAVGASNVVVYVCDGDGGVAEYFWGSADDMPAIAIDGAGGASVRAELVDGAFAGTLTLSSGAEHEFTTEPAVGDAGMYFIAGQQAVAAGVSGGWIIDNDGDERGALIRNGSLLSTRSFDSGGLVLNGERFAVVRQSSPTKPPIAPPVPIPLPNCGSGPKCRD